MVIPIITFIEGRMRILMGMITRDYLRAHRLAPTQCAPNMFRILGCVDALNERMGLGPYPSRCKLDLQPPPLNQAGVLPEI